MKLYFQNLFRLLFDYTNFYKLALFNIKSPSLCIPPPQYFKALLLQITQLLIVVLFLTKNPLPYVSATLFEILLLSPSIVNSPKQIFLLRFLLQ